MKKNTKLNSQVHVSFFVKHQVDTSVCMLVQSEMFVTKQHLLPPKPVVYTFVKVCVNYIKNVYKTNLKFRILFIMSIYI